MENFRVSAPATSGNLGPGFDELGLAYDLRLEVVAKRAKHFEAQTVGEGAEDLPTDGSNLILASYREMCSALNLSAPPLSIEVRNPIPICGGLGSSATALVCGMALAYRVHGREVDRESIFQRAAAAEGHPDNVAPSVFGGLNRCGGQAWHFTSARMAIHPGIRVLLVTPDAKADTATMREALPCAWSEEDRHANKALTEKLVKGLADGKPEGLACSQRDRMHQPYRFPLQPKSECIFKYLCDHPDVAGSFLSGSGPTVAGWLLDKPDLIAESFRGPIEGLVGPVRIWMVSVDHEGLQVGTG